MSEVIYEYGELYQYKEWEELRWTFRHGNHGNTEFNRDDTLLECMNQLGELGWKLSLKSDDNEYIFIREKK